MSLRMFRVAEPARMHFDEVYHARTATEFLQSWRYGIDHSIYEWTHPHLAKYAMAGGIVLFAGHDVAAGSEIGSTVTDAAIEPRRESDSAARAGNRVWVATGDGVRAFDLLTRKPVLDLPIAGAISVAWDGDGVRLFVGTSTGELWTIDGALVDDMLGSSSGAAPDEVPVDATQVGTVDGPIERLALFDGGGSLAAQVGPTTLAILDPSTGEERGRLDIPALGEMTAAGSADAIVARTADVTDPEGLAKELVAVLGGDETAYLDQLRSGADRVFIDAELTDRAGAAGSPHPMVTSGESNPSAANDLTAAPRSAAASDRLLGAAPRTISCASERTARPS